MIRDELLGRETTDIDVVISGDPESAARSIAGACRGAAFPLSDEFGGWRVVPQGDTWQVDLTPLAEGGIEADLGRRDFTVNAIARPLAGGDEIDPHGGRADLAAGLLRAVSSGSFEADPLRVVRLARISCCLELDADGRTLDLARQAAARLESVAGERILSELLQILACDDPRAGIELLDAAGALRAILPEVDEIDGLGQSSFHHLDVWAHTLAVLDRAVSLQADPSPLGPAAADAVSLLGEPLADGVDRWVALRVGALFHDIAKGRTRKVFDGGRVGFPGHDSEGAAMASDALARLRASTRMRDRVATLVAHHLDAGFMTHRMPIGARDVHSYLVACGPAAVDVTVISVADRLATLGRKADESISRHLEVTDELLEAAVRVELEGFPEPLVRGDELAVELGIEPGPLLGELVAELAAAHWAEEVTTREQAVDWARKLLASTGSDDRV